MLEPWANATKLNLRGRKGYKRLKSVRIRGAPTSCPVEQAFPNTNLSPYICSRLMRGDQCPLFYLT